MAQQTNIEWADATVNVWTGCTKVSAACRSCYAEHDTPVRVAEHAVGVQLGTKMSSGKVRLKMWGKHQPETGAGYRVETVGWEKSLRALNRKAKKDRLAAGPAWCRTIDRPRVFINSLSDTFEGFHGPIYRKDAAEYKVVAQNLDDVRARFFRVVEECDELDILLLTKRPENVVDMAPSGWTCERMGDACDDRCGWPKHVWMGTTVENQEQADQRIPELLRIPASVRFLSMEPLLEKVDLCNLDILRQGATCGNAPARPGGARIALAIIGSESGNNRRTTEVHWVDEIVEQCKSAGVACFVKQFETVLGHANGDKKGGDPKWWPKRWPREMPHG